MKNKNILAVLIVLMLAFNANAFTLNHYSRNAYDFTPLSNVHIVLTCNETNISVDGFSDTNSLNAFTIDDAGNYSLTAYRPGYTLKETNFEINETETKVSYLTYTTDSYIKFTFSDMTFNNNREWCFYYDNNTHLLGCYYPNSTILLSPAHNYTIYPKMAILEQIGIMPLSTSFLTQILIFLITGALIVLLIFAVLGVGLWFVRKLI